MNCESIKDREVGVLNITSYGNGRIVSPRNIALCLLCFFISVNGFAQSFEQAWRQVLTVDDELSAERAKLASRSSLAAVADDLNWPRLDLNMAYVQMADPIQLDLLDLEPLASAPGAITSLPGLLGVPTVTNFTDDSLTTVSLQAMWPIFTGGKIAASQAIISSQYDESRAEFKLKITERFGVLVERYYGLELARHYQLLQEQVVSSIDAHANDANLLQQQGQIARVEVLQAQVALDDALVGLARAKSQVTMAELALNQLLHSNVTRLQSQLFIDVELAPVAHYVDGTLNTFPGLDVLDAKLAQSDAAIDLQKSEYAPSVFLFGDYQAYEGESLLADMTPDWQVGVGISIPLISNTGRSARVKAAHDVQLEVQSLSRKTRSDLQLLVNHSYEQARQAQLEYRRLLTAIELADENIKLREKAFREGLGTSRDLVDATTYKAGVEMRRAAAAYQFVRHYAQLCALSSAIETFIISSESAQ